MKREFFGIRTILRVTALAGVGSVFVLCIGLGVVLFSPDSDNSDRTRLEPPQPESPHAKSSDPGWYFRSGQCRADVRTLFEAVRYILESEDDQADRPSFRLPSGVAIPRPPFRARAESSTPPQPLADTTNSYLEFMHRPRP